MQFRNVMLCVLGGLVTGAVGAQTAPNWLFEALTVGIPQSTVVRDPIDTGKYYLCWTDGTNRFGTTFRRASLDQKLRAVPRGGRQSAAAMMGTGTSTWTAADEKVCWPK